MTDPTNDGPTDPSRRKAIRSLAIGGLFANLLRIIPDELIEATQEPHLSLVEELYKLGSVIRASSARETHLLIENVYSPALAGLDTTSGVDLMIANRAELEKMQAEFNALSAKAAAQPELHGWSKKFHPDFAEKLTINESGVTVTKTSAPSFAECRRRFAQGETFIPYDVNEVPIDDYTRTTKTMHEAIEQMREQGKFLHEKIYNRHSPKTGNAAPAPSRYELSQTKGEKNEFGFGQDERSWRRQLHEEHLEFSGHGRG